MRILIKNGRIIDPAHEIDTIADILINNSLIEKIDRNIRDKTGTAQIFDATDLIVSPGLIDVHCHLREPGYEWKETIRTGTQAAARGGFTSVVCMANTNPVNDTKSITDYIIEKARTEASCRVFPCGAVTKGLQGKDLAEIGEMVEAGIVAVSDDGKSVKNAALMRKALEYIKRFSIPVISHCEDDDLASGFVHEGEASLLSGLEATPALAEEIIVLRDIAIARYVDAPLHLTHISTEESVNAIGTAKKYSDKITCDTCPHYFTLTDDAILTYDTNAKVNPPLRSKSHVAAIREGLRDGTIDIIATDHAPHEFNSKDVEFDIASYGISGFETALGLSLGLVHDGVLTLPELIKKLTLSPARLLGLPYGELTPGRPADLIVFSPHLTWTVNKNTFVTKGKNTPFHGWTLKGKNLMTIVDGKISFHDRALKAL